MSEYKTVGATRLLAAAGHSLRGVRDTWRTEAAFRQEIVLGSAVGAAVFMLEVPPLWRVLLLLTFGLVLVVELLNTAIEATVDRFGRQHHPLSGKAKDAGSAAVAAALLLHVLVWACVPW